MEEQCKFGPGAVAVCVCVIMSSKLVMLEIYMRHLSLI